MTCSELAEQVMDQLFASRSNDLLGKEVAEQANDLLRARRAGQ
jgi:hypothetical protein